MFLATTGLVWAISAGIGPLLGGIFSEYLTWRWAFWINLPCCVVAFVVLFSSIRSVQPASIRTGQQKTMDWAGTVAILGVNVMVLLSLDFGGVVSPWDSPKVLGLLVGGGVLMAFFVFWEAKGASSPLIPPRLLQGCSRISPLVVCFTHGFVCQ
jgi:MFS family permease